MKCLATNLHCNLSSNTTVSSIRVKSVEDFTKISETVFIRNFEHIFQGLLQDISRTIYQFSRTFHIAKNEMALKAPLNTAGGLGGAYSLPLNPGQSPGRGPEGQSPGKLPISFISKYLKMG